VISGRKKNTVIHTVIIFFTVCEEEEKNLFMEESFTRSAGIYKIDQFE